MGAAASGYASALDIYAHVKRLRALYPDSALVTDIFQQAEQEMQNLITILVTSLQAPALKLAGAMRTIGWLRRVAPDLATNGQPTNLETMSRGARLSGQGTEEGSLGALFLVCRLATLGRTLQALEPLRELADQETTKRSSGSHSDRSEERSTVGTQTERYLKRYIEIFREQSFAIISMYKSIFPTALPMPGGTTLGDAVTSPTGTMASGPTMPMMGGAVGATQSASEGLPSALATFAPHLVDMLFDQLREYMPNVSDRSSRDSLLTQVLYCAGSLGRLGADFGMMLALLEDELRDSDDERHEDAQEWVQVMKKHRVQASRLELLASGVGSSRKGSVTPDARAAVAASAAQ